jgi:hypothetical protein
MNLVKLAHLGKTSGFRFSIPIDGRAIQIVWNNSPFFLTLDSPDLAHCLILSLEQELPNDISLGHVSTLALFPSEIDTIKTSSPHLKQALELVKNRLSPQLKHLILYNIDLGDNIDLISISQLKLNMIYLQDCDFFTGDLIWSVLSDSMQLFDFIYDREGHDFKFTLKTNGHITQIVSNDGLFLSPNSSDLVHGLMVDLGEDLPNDFSLDGISFLTIFQSKTYLDGPLPSRSEQTLKSVIARPFPGLKYLFLSKIFFHGNIENLISISELRLDLIYLYGCSLKTADPIWSIICSSANLVRLMQMEEVHGLHFAVPANGHIVQIAWSDSVYTTLPKLSGLVHGLILRLGQDLPNDLSFDDISFLVVLPSEANLPSQQLCSHSKQNPNPTKSNQFSKLEYLFLKGVSLNDAKEGYDFIQPLDWEAFTL